MAPATVLSPVRCSAPSRADTAERGATVAASDRAEALTVAIDAAVPFDVKARQSRLGTALAAASMRAANFWLAP